MCIEYKSFGFNYEFDGKSWAFDVRAKTAEEAVEKVSSMGNAILVGELLPVGEPVKRISGIDRSRLPASI